MKENLMMIKQMDLEFIIIPMEQSMLGIGKMIFNKVMEQKHGRMDKNIKDNIKEEKDKVKELIYLLMDQNIVDNGMIIK